MKDKAIEALINTLNDGAKNIPKITETMIRQYQQSQLFYGIASFTIATLLIIVTVWVWMKLFGEYKQYKISGAGKKGMFSTSESFSDFVCDRDLETVFAAIVIGTLVVGAAVILLLINSCDNIGNYISPISGFIKDVLNN
jgi:hypothetical protein